MASDPDRTCSKGDGRGMDRKGHGLRRLSRRGVETDQRLGARIGDPKASGAVGERGRIAPEVDRLGDRSGLRVDPADRPGGSACHPHRPAADCDVAWAAADGDPVDNSRRGRVNP